MFTIKEVANNLQVSTQAIYKQKDELIEKGYMIKNKQGSWEITDNGFNYLKDKRIKFIQQYATSTQPIESSKGIEEPLNAYISIENEVVNLLKKQLQTIENQLQEMTEQRNYFKAKFEEKDNLCNQYMNSHLLQPTEEEITQAKDNPIKKNLWQRLFNK